VLFIRASWAPVLGGLLSCALTVIFVALSYTGTFRSKRT